MGWRGTLGLCTTLECKVEAEGVCLKQSEGDSVPRVKAE